MHELSLAGGVLKVVEDAAQREGFVRVRRLTLEAGALAGVEPRALRFALDSLAPGTCLEGAEITIAERAAPAWCHGCCETVEVRSRLDDCPRCGSSRLVPTGGTELRVHELIVHDD
ncbi:hydrogenase maturation nickel metallochaperone HypA [Pseudorhodoferax sp.]|uniref:hydrogenase maturation nickel metallochaperone HypA n=1 Tax=Pseudorhodoferax sp. TaxID=1993553 RepID=UPI002DD6528F|nr:hydrogenase maturation nickel metallochaperone HypA [Pseudorhodoferax sp.]